MDSTQAVLGRPIRLGTLDVANRLVRSATYENMAEPDGSASDALVRLYERLGRGGAGLVITGHAFVQQSGKAGARQMGVHDDAMLPGLARLASAIQAGGAKAIIEIAHAGSQTSPQVTGSGTAGPSAGFQPLYASRSRAMTDAEIRDAAAAFGLAARRAREAGFDGIQIHGAHGYLVSQFLSPRDNRRRDAWGGSEEKRFAFLGEVIESVRREVGRDYPVLLKINGSDVVRGGLKPKSAAVHARRAAEAGVDAVEVSAGSIGLAPFAVCRGEIPVDAFAGSAPKKLRSLVRRIQPLADLYGRLYPFREAYNGAFAREIRPGLAVPLILVGGMRTPAAMVEVVSSGEADMISLARPLVREPGFPKRILSGDPRPTSCISCNRCLAADADPRTPLKCYARA